MTVQDDNKTATGLQILVVMTRYPLPPRTGSAIVALNHIKHLARNHHIHMICCDAVDDPGELARYVDSLELVSRPVGCRVCSGVRNLFYLALGVPVFVTKNRCPEMKSRIRQFAKEKAVDAVLLFEMSSIQYLPANCLDRAIVNIEDPPSLKFRRMYRLGALPLREKIKILLSMRAITRFEKSALPRLAKVLLLSQSDIDDVRTQSGITNLAHVSYGIPQIDPEKLLRLSARRPGSIVFSGTMSHPPNIDAALYFLTEIFPAIVDRFPSAELSIVGRSPDARILSAAARYGDRVRVTGAVDDVAEYIRRAMVCVCPVRLKIGVQTKVLEALSWGTPVVTTEAGNSGIGAISGHHLWVGKDPASFARQVVGLLNGEDWTRLSEAGRTFVQSHHTWETSVAQLEVQMRSLNISA